MGSLGLALLFLVCLAASLGLGGLVRSWLLARGILDKPNERSSHRTPTPRGGGIALLAVLLPAWGLTEPRLLPILALALALAAVGWWDDLKGLAPWPRLAAQVVAVGFGLWHLAPIAGGLLPPVLDYALAGILWLWFINLFNFMDGIDGIASVEAISVMTFATLLIFWQRGEPSIVFALLVVVAAAAGFLIWNWPPARIFMGDAGSGFLGFFVGSIAWATIVRGRLSIWVWLILLGAFIVDATVTLLRRWVGGARLAEAHRSHAYQRLSRKYRSHLKVTLGILLLNALWLDPLAYLAAARPAWGAAFAIVAWAPLIVVAWTSGAGTEGD